MADKSKTLVLFDVGGVLLHLDFNRFYEEAAKLSKQHNAEAFKNLYVSSGLEGIFDRGNITIDEYLAKLNGMIFVERHLSRAELEVLIEYRLGSLITENIGLKRKVGQAGYSVGIFSNTTELDVQLIARKWPEIYETFGKSAPKILSYAIHALKPEPAMFRQISGYDKVVFIDDRASYVLAGIEQFGWHGIHYAGHIDEAEAVRIGKEDSANPTKNFLTAKSTEELAKALNKFGVKV